MLKYIKNNSAATLTYQGQDIGPGVYFLIPATEDVNWMLNNELLADISSGAAVVSKTGDSSGEILNAADGLRYLSNLLPSEVVTQFEKNDKDLKLCCAGAAVDGVTGEAIIYLQVPGALDPEFFQAVPNPDNFDRSAGSGRYIDEGAAFFDVSHAGDKIKEIWAVIRGPSSAEDVLLKAYHDEDQSDVNNQGWIIPPKRGQVEIDTMAGYGFCPRGCAIKVVAQKSAGNFSGTFFMNLKWGKKG